MIHPSLRSLVFSLITASSLVALSSSSYAMDLPQTQQSITEIAKQLQVLKNLEAQLQKRKGDYEIARREFLAWNGENHKKEELNEKQESCKGAIAVTENDIKNQKTLLCKQQIQQLKQAKKEFQAVFKLHDNLDSWENKSDSLQCVSRRTVHGTKLMEEVESNLLDDPEVEEKLKSVKCMHADAKGAPEYLTGLLQQIEKLKEAEQNFTETMTHLNDIDSSEDRKKLFNSAQVCEMNGAKLMEEVQSTYFVSNDRIRKMLEPLKNLQSAVTKKYDEKFSQYYPPLSMLPPIKKLERVEEIFNAIFPLAQDFDASEDKSGLLQIILNYKMQGEQLLAEVEFLKDNTLEEKLRPLRGLSRDVEGTCRACTSNLQSEKVATSPPFSGVKIEEKEKSVVTAVFQIPTVATPAPKPEATPIVMIAPTPKLEETIPAVMTAPVLERGTPPPPPGPLVPGQMKSGGKKPDIDKSAAAKPQTPKGPVVPNTNAPPADLMAQMKEAQRQRAAKQEGEQPSGKTPIPQIQNDVLQIEKPKALFRLGTSTKKDKKGDDNISTLSSQSAAPQDAVSKPLSPIELEVQTLESKLAALPKMTLALQDKTAVEKHNAEKAGIFEQLKVTLTNVKKEKAVALQKLQDDRQALSQKDFEGLPPAEKIKKEKERDQQRKVLNAQIKIAGKELTESFVKKIDHKIQFFTWKNEESLRMQAIHKSSRTDLKSILDKREQEIQKKRAAHKSQWSEIDEKRLAGAKVNVLQPLRLKAGELETEIAALEKLQKNDQTSKIELRSLIKYSKEEVEENTKKINSLENKKRVGPSKKDSAAPHVTTTLFQSFASKTLVEIVEKNANLLLDQSVIELEQNFDNDEVGSNSLTPEQKVAQATQEAEERAKNLAAAKAAAEEAAKYKAEQEAYNKTIKTDQASLEKQRKDEEARKGFSMRPQNLPSANNDDDVWSE